MPVTVSSSTTVSERRNTDLTNYDPGEGLKKIAVAEAAETHFARAKNAEGLFAAITEKLTEQRNFIVWYKAQPKDKGGGDPTIDRSVDGGVVKVYALFQIDPDNKRAIKSTHKMLDRWFNALFTEENFENTLEKAQEKCRRICEFEKEIGAMGGSEDNEWYTPEEWIERARNAMGSIDCDPASNSVAQEIVKATTWYNAETNGLHHDWNGNIFLNPPYGRGLVDAFVDKTIAEHSAERLKQAVLLLDNSTETEWSQAIYSIASAVAFTRGRIRFYQPGGDSQSPTNGSVFVYIGSNVKQFVGAFSEACTCFAPIAEDI
jgi:phage N-6-adenine-methyltransferase